MEANGLYAIIHCWWLLSRVAFEACVHELVNWFKILAFLCHAMGRFHGPSEYFDYKLLIIPFFFNLKILFHFSLNLYLDILVFFHCSFPLICRSSMMRNGHTCPFESSINCALHLIVIVWDVWHLFVHNDV